MVDEIYFDGVAFFSASEAAESAGLTRDYIARLCKDGKLIGKRIGKQWYVSRESLHSFALEQEYSRERRREELAKSRRNEYREKAQHLESENKTLAHRTRIADVRPARIPEYVHGTLSAIARAPLAAQSVRAMASAPVHAISIGKQATAHALPPITDVLHKLVAVITALLFTVGTYLFVDAQYARIAERSSTFATALEFGSRQFALASENPAEAFGGIFERIARGINRSVDSLVYQVMYPAQLTGVSPSRELVEVRVVPRRAAPVAASLAQGTTNRESPSTARTVITQPVIERVVETQRIVAAAGGLTEEILSARLNQLDNKLTSQILSIRAQAPVTATTIVQQATAGATRIDDLGSITLRDSTITGGSISGTSVSATSLTVTGTGTSTFSGGIQATALNITTSGTSTFSGGLQTGGFSASGQSSLATTTISTLTVTGDTTLQGTLSIPGALTITSSTISLLTNTYATTSFISAVTASTTNLTWVTATGTNTILTNATSSILYVSNLASFGTASTTNLTLNGFSQDRIPYIGASGAVTSSSVLTFDGTLLKTTNASTSIFSSFGPAYFGGSATSTFTNAGRLGILTASPNYPLEVTGAARFSSTVDAANIVATSTSATSTFAGGLLATRIPSTAHTFSSWVVGAANSALFDAALVVNPASAGGDTNLISAGVNGSVKFLVDAEGDVFVNNLTSVGSVTLSTTSASTFTVENNTSLGDSSTDVTTITGTLTVSGTTTVASVAGKFGIGTTSPWAKLSVHANNGETNTSLFTIASSTASATTTLFDISNTGAITSVGVITSTAGGANTFPYASSTALSVSGTGYFTTASTTNLTVSGIQSAVPYTSATGVVSGASLAASSIFVTNGSSVPSWTTTLPAFTLGGAVTGGNQNITGLGSLTAYASSTIGSGLQGGGLTIFGGATTTGFLAITGTTGTTSIASGQGFTIGGSQFMLQQGSGNVGIGTASPRSKLHIAGDWVLADNTYGFGAQLAGNSGIFSSFDTDASDNTFIHARGDGSSGTKYFHIQTYAGGWTTAITAASNGKVGIFNSTPAYPLDVIGTAHFNGTVDAANFVATSTSVASTFAYNVGIGTTSPWKMLSVAGDIIGTNVTATGTLAVTGTSGTSTIASGQGFTIGSSQFVLQQGSGNVGIGTASPSQALTLGGDNYHLLVKDGGKLYIRDTASYIQEGGGLNIVSGLDRSLNLAGGTGTDLTISSAGNVGIGTTSPWKMLSVAGDIIGTNITATGTLSVAGASAFTGGFTSYASSTIGDGTRAGGLTIFGGATTTGNAYFAGNVGIGTTSPTSKLSVDGTGISSGITLGTTGNGLNRIYNNDGVLTLLNNSGASTMSMTFDRGSNGWQLTNSVTGITGAFYQLSMLGSAASGVQQGFTINPTWTQGGTAGYTALVVNPTESSTGSGARNIADFQLGGTSRFVIQSGGNIGIGTTTPYHKLTVWGADTSANTTSFLIANSASTTVFTVSNTGSTTIASVLNVAGTATSSIGGGLATPYLNITGSSASSTFGNGINLATGCFSVNGTCLVSNSQLLASANTWTALQSLSSGASTTLLSVFNKAYFGGTATTTIDSTGIITAAGVIRAAVGSADVPGLSFENPSDANSRKTGLYLPATGILGFSTAGNEVMRIDATGNVGVGTTSPQTKFEVVNTSSGATADQLYLSNLASATSTASRLSFRTQDIINNTGTTTAALTSILKQNFNTGKGDLAFSTLQSGALTEAMRLTAAGYLGIGTSTPYNKVTIWGSDTSAITTSFLISDSASTTIFKLTNNGQATFNFASTTAANVSGTLFSGTASTSNLTVSGAPSGILQTSAIGVVSALTTSAALASNLSDETGSNNGALVFSAGPTFTGTTLFASLKSTEYASTTLFSAYGRAYFGGSATSSFALDGSLNVATAFTAYASSTIGAGGAGTGLTIFGGATTTGFARFRGGAELYGTSYITHANGTRYVTIYPANVADGATFSDGAGSADTFSFGSGGIATRGTGIIGWAAANDVRTASYDTAFSRASAGVVDLGTGAAGSKAGSLNLANLTATGLLSLTNASSSRLSVFDKAYFGATATTTIDSTGAITVTSTSANTFPYASTTALTVSGTGYFGTASTSALTVSNNATVGGTLNGITFLTPNTSSFYAVSGGVPAVTTATDNTALGYQALSSATVSYNNTAVGSQALKLTTGYYNTAVGWHAGAAMTTAWDITAIGRGALANNTAGENTAVGSNALATNVSGSSLTAVGYQALLVNTGNYNTAVGHSALMANTTGAGNTALGYQAGAAITTGENNLAIGYQALDSNVSGSWNIALGVGSLTNTTSGNNTAIGVNAGSANTSGANNTFIGQAADAASGALTNATAIGYGAIVGASNSLVLGGTGANAVNVGIGTTSPQTKLEVVNTSSGATADQLYLSNLASATSTASRLSFRTQDIINNTGTTTSALTSILKQNFNTGKGDLAFSTLQSGTLTEAMRLTAAGDLGIGTSTPYHKLTIWGSDTSANTTSFLISDSASTTIFKLTNNGQATFNFASTTAANVSGTLFSGTASTTNLTVSGAPSGILQTSAIGVVSALTTSASIASNLSDETGSNNGALVFSAGPTFTGTTLFASLRTTGNASTTLFSAYGPAYFGGSATSSFALDGSLNVATAFTAYASSTIGSGTQAGGLTISGGATTTGNLIVQGGSTSTFSNGISATYLNITGTSATSTFARGINLAGGCFSINGTCVGGGGGSGTINSGTTGQFPYYASSGTTLSATSSIYLATSGNVGIGTTSPSAKLEISASSTASMTGDLLYLTNLSSATSTASRLTFRTDDIVHNTGTSTAALTSIIQQNFNTGKGDLAFSTLQSGALTEVMRITSLGYLGVGTTTPYRKLSVTDTVSNAQFALAYDGTRVSQFQTDASGDLVIDPSGNDVLLSDDNLLVCTTSCGTSPSGTGSVLVENKLGVGTTTPAAKLTIETSDSTTNFLQIASTTAQSLLVMTANGNLGLATSSPFAKFTVGAGGAITTVENALTDSATIAVSWLDGNQQRVTLGGNRTINFSNYVAGQILRLVVCQDSTGSRTVTWDSAVLWNGDSAPTLTTTANQCDLATFIATNATGTLKIFGAAALAF